MKKVRTIPVIVILTVAAMQCFSQGINWENLKREERNIVHANVGYDFGLMFGAGYGYQLKTKLRTLLTSSISFPAGRVLFDDLKTRLGVQFRCLRINHFQFSAGLFGVYREYENSLVRLKNFGSDMDAVIGLYQPRWFIAGEFGFDKAIVTYFKHTESFRTNVYGNVVDGWFEPSTGGNFNYGFQAGYSFGHSDVTLKAGKIATQNFEGSVLMPYYLQLGYAFKISEKRYQ